MEVKDEEVVILNVRPRPSETIHLKVPTDVVASLDAVAQRKDMSRDALLRFYIGQSLRDDLTQMFGDRVLTTMEQVLTRHKLPPEDVQTILREVQQEARPSK